MAGRQHKVLGAVSVAFSHLHGAIAAQVLDSRGILMVRLAFEKVGSGEIDERLPR